MYLVPVAARELLLRLEQLLDLLGRLLVQRARVGERALELFLGWEQQARAEKPAFAGRRLGWLARTVSAAAVHGAARGVLDAFSPPDGQERAHLRGAAAA